MPAASIFSSRNYWLAVSRANPPIAMRIYTRKYTSQGIPIVPMLDILTILLIFFIVHTEFKRQVNVLTLEIPQTRHLAGEQGDNQILLLELGADDSLAFNGQRISPQELVAAVQQAVQQRPGATIQVAAAGGASMARFVEVMDTLTAAGLKVEEVPVRIDYRP